MKEKDKIDIFDMFSIDSELRINNEIYTKEIREIFATSPFYLMFIIFRIFNSEYPLLTFKFLIDNFEELEIQDSFHVSSKNPMDCIPNILEDLDKFFNKELLLDKTQGKLSPDSLFNISNILNECFNIIYETNKKVKINPNSILSNIRKFLNDKSNIELFIEIEKSIDEIKIALKSENDFWQKKVKSEIIIDFGILIEHFNTFIEIYPNNDDIIAFIKSELEDIEEKNKYYIPPIVKYKYKDFLFNYIKQNKIPIVIPEMQNEERKPIQNTLNIRWNLKTKGKKDGYSQNDFIELCKALVESKAIIGSQKDIISAFSDLLNIQINTPDQQLQSLKKSRNNDSQTKFIDTLKKSLDEWLNKEK